MARLGPPAALHVTGECVEVGEGEKDGEVVCTLSRAVEVYNLYDHRCVHSWPLNSTDCVTCHAHYHRGMGKYCAVRNSNELLLWTSEDKSLPSTHLTLPSSPLSLLSPSLPNCLVTVDGAGSVSMVTVRGGEVVVLSEVVIGGRQTRSKQLKILTSCVCDVGGRECVVVMCKSGEVYVCALNEKELSIMYTLVLSSKLVKQSVAAVGGETLVVAGSNGTVATYDLGHIASNPHPLTTTHSSAGARITGVSSNYFAMADQEGVVSLRDTIYGTCQSSMKTGFRGISLVHCVYGHLVVCGGEGVRVLSVSGVSEASLASLLGRKPTEATLVIPQWVEPAQTCTDWESEVMARGSDEESIVQQLSDPKKTPTLEAVVSLFPSPLTLHSLAYAQVSRRLTAEREFWAHATLVELVRYGAVAGSATGELVTRALEQKDWSLVALTLNYCQHLPEDTLVSLLLHTLELPAEVESYGERLKQEDILWATLALPYSDSLLQLPLSRLPLSAVLSLLQFLTPHVSVASLSTHPPIPYPHLLDWLAVILDTHWTALVLSPKARDILKNYKHTTYHQMLFCENMATVQNMLESARNPCPRQPLDQKYSVERIKLKI